MLNKHWRYLTIVFYYDPYYTMAYEACKERVLKEQLERDRKDALEIENDWRKFIQRTRLSRLNSEMIGAGLTDTMPTAIRLSAVFEQVGEQTLLTGQPVSIPLIPDINPLHESWVATWLILLPARIQTVINSDRMFPNW